MRVTTQMISKGCKRSKLPIRSNSLIDALNKKENLQHPLLASMQSKGASASGNTAFTGNKATAGKSASREQSKKMKKAAEELLSQMEKETDAVAIADRYNSLLTALGSSADSLSQFYRQSLQELTAAHKEQLAEVGITTAKSGRLQVNKGKLKEAPQEKVDALFSKDSIFMSRVGFIAERVADRAKANMSAGTGNYSNSGTMTYYTKNRYDRKG